MAHDVDGDADGTPPIQSATLDTNLLLEHWKSQDRMEVVGELVTLAREGRLDLAVTARVHEDVPDPPLSDRINDLPDLNIERIGTVTRLGFWSLGRDMLGSEHFVEVSDELQAQLEQEGRAGPDWRDWDHLHAPHAERRFPNLGRRRIGPGGRAEAAAGHLGDDPGGFLGAWG